MAVSQNGYTANDRTLLTQYVVSDAGLVMNLRKGSPGELLAHMVRWFDANIRNIDAGALDDWSYAERPISGSQELSNHASGTAVDVDATKWPLGVKPEAYLTADEIARVRIQLKVYQGCIRWGGDYDRPEFGGVAGSRTDPMHFEVNRDLATCDRVWAGISTPPEEIDVSAEERLHQSINGRLDQKVIPGIDHLWNKLVAVSEAVEKLTKTVEALRDVKPPVA